MIWNIRKQKTTNWDNKKKKRILKNVDRVNSFWDKFKRYNTHIITVLEGEENDQDIGNLLEKIMKENFPNLVKEIHMQV